MGELTTMTPEEYQEYEKKMRAKSAVDTILQAEQHKKDKDLGKHIKAEMKERAKHLESAMGGKKDKKEEKKSKPEPKKTAKPAPKKRK